MKPWRFLAAVRIALVVASTSGVCATARAEQPANRHAAEASLLPSNARPPPPPVASRGKSLAALYDEGFRLRTADGATELRIAWSTQLDTRVPVGGGALVPSFDIRRARLDLIATIEKKLFVRIGVAAEDQPYLRNAFADYEIGEALHVRVGQMKVPFSTEWATLDNQVNFIERAHAQPITPFLDRGVLLWGRVPGAPLVWNLGAFAGAGLDSDAPRGDVDAGKELAFRIFTEPLRGLYLVSQGTWEPVTSVTKRFETRGTVTPTFESNVWRWTIDPALTTTIDSKSRVGVEAHFLKGPLSLSTELATLRWSGIEVARGPDTLLRTSGDARTASIWTSVFVTGERKALDNFGWRQPNPLRPMLGGDGWGALELLARASVIDTADSLFEKQANVAVLQGARRMNEVTLGASWTLAYATRVQLNLVHTWVPDARSDNGIVSGASSEIADPTRRNVLVPAETMLAARVIFRI